MGSLEVSQGQNTSPSDSHGPITSYSWPKCSIFAIFHRITCRKRLQALGLSRTGGFPLPKYIARLPEKSKR